MKRLSIKSTQSAIDIMKVVANNRHCDISDMVHQYFYDLAQLELLESNNDGDAETLLYEIFSQALLLK